MKTATRLWFNDIEPISAHTLAFAAYEVVHSVSKAIDPNRPELLLDSSLISPVYRNAVHRRLKAAARFFKHADKDPHGTLDFYQDLTWSFIYYGIYGLQVCNVDLIDEFITFNNWVGFNMPEILTDEARHFYIDSHTVDHVTQLRALSKQEFFDLCMETLRLSRA